MKRIELPDHNRLQATAVQLKEDRNQRAAEYQERYEAAQQAYDHIVRVGGSFKAAADTRKTWPPFRLGRDLADLLVQNGWTPPVPITVVDEPEDEAAK